MSVCGLLVAASSGAVASISGLSGCMGTAAAHKQGGSVEVMR